MAILTFKHLILQPVQKNNCKSKIIYIDMDANAFKKALTLKRWLIMIVFLLIYSFSVIGFFIHLFLSKKDRNKKELFELLILYQIVVNIGILSLVSAMALLFMPKMVADTLGWPTCPFQHELGNVNLAFGVLGILCIWLRGNFWLATIIGASIWLIGDGIGHLSLLNTAQTLPNAASGVEINNWIMLITDFMIPITLLLLLFAYRKLDATSDKT